MFPAAFAITWRGQSRAGAISGAISGLFAGLIAWLVVAKQYFGTVTVATTGTEYATLAGNLAAVMTGLIVTVAVSLIKPQNFDWEITRAINAIPVTPGVPATAPATAPAKLPVTRGPEGLQDPTPLKEQEKHSEKDGEGDESGSDVADVGIHELQQTTSRRRSIIEEEEAEMAADAKIEEEPRKLRGAFKLACIASFVLTFLMDFIVSSTHDRIRYCTDEICNRFLCRCFSATTCLARASSLAGSSYRSSGCLSVPPFL